MQSNTPKFWSVLPTVLASLAFAGRAPAQWAAVSLHPAGTSGSEGRGGAAGQPVGSVAPTAGLNHAAVWNGLTSSWTDLNPAGGFRSECADGDGVQQVGFVDYATDRVATVWSGSAASAVSLNPPGCTFAQAFSVSSGSQVGRFDVGNTVFHAALWSGTAASIVDLNPPGIVSSTAFGVRGNQQVGAVGLGGFSHASSWSGTAATWVDLAPPMAGHSIAYATDGVQQVGSLTLAGTFSAFACMWSGTAASFVDLTPAGSSISEALDVDAGQQCGYASMPFLSPHACVWSGSAASFVDLHPALPANYSGSRANAIWHANGRTYVLGRAHNATSNRDEAILWSSLKREVYCTGKLNSAGCTPNIGTIGFAASATNLRNNVNGLMLYGNAGRASIPFANGTLCIASPRLRGTPLNSGGSNPPIVDCSGVFQVELHAFRDSLLASWPTSFLSVPGTLVDFQFWARDPGFAPPNNAQLSNAIELELAP